MTDQQYIPLQDATRVTIDVSGMNGEVRWSADADHVAVSGAEAIVDRAADELFLRVDRSASRGTRRSESNSAGLAIVLPVAIAVSRIEIEDGDLSLESPTGQVECEVKTGTLRSTGGAAELLAIAGSNDVYIAGLDGSIHAIGGSGDVEIVDSRATTNIKAGSGDVTLTRVTGGAIKVLAGSGDVEITDCGAEAIAVEVGSGSVSLSGGQLDRTTVRTGSGDVDCATVFGAYGQSIMTGTGTVSFGMPQGLAARVEVTTSRGDIDSELPLVSVGQRGPRSRHNRRQVGSIGEGEPRAEVSIRTGSGDIRLYWLDVPARRPDGTPRTPPPAGEHATAASRTPGAEHSGDASSATAKEILEALSRGEITVEEADALLSKIDGSEGHDS